MAGRSRQVRCVAVANVKGSGRCSGAMEAKRTCISGQYGTGQCNYALL
jgi:hypothetical protein